MLFVGDRPAPLALKTMQIHLRRTGWNVKPFLWTAPTATALLPGRFHRDATGMSGGCSETKT
jgi:hypothetical protein